MRNYALGRSALSKTEEFQRNFQNKIFPLNTDVAKHYFKEKIPLSLDKPPIIAYILAITIKKGMFWLIY